MAFTSYAVARVLHPLGSSVNTFLETFFILARVAVVFGFLVERRKEDVQVLAPPSATRAASPRGRLRSSPTAASCRSPRSRKRSPTTTRATWGDNQVYTPPREILDSLPGARTVEMHRCKERGFCFGAGGARMWMEEAIATDAELISTACPFCIIMLSDDAVTDRQQAGAASERVQVLDVSQILARSLRSPPAAGHDDDDAR